MIVYFAQIAVKGAYMNIFNHLTHDCRHTVISKLDSAGANKVAVDRIVGHSSKSVGEQVYTHKTVKELQEAIEKIVYVSARS